MVTRESLAAMVAREDNEYVVRVVGRALVAIFNNQTKDEKSANTAAVFNSIGFTGADAKSGSITAKYYLKHGTLLDWQVAKWIAPAKNGFPKICKYARQLDEIARAKAA